MLKGFLEARRPPKVSNEMKCTNEKMTWNTQDINLSSYVPKANVDHTINGQGTGISTFDHSAITPVMLSKSYVFRWDFNINSNKTLLWFQWKLVPQQKCIPTESTFSTVKRSGFIFNNIDRFTDDLFTFTWKHSCETSY